MITRYALFEGSIKPSQHDAFKDYVNQTLIPLWTQFDGAHEVRVMFGEERDEGAPEFPLILAISYPDQAALDRAMACDARFASRDATKGLLAMFDGRVHHHVTSAQNFTL